MPTADQILSLFQWPPNWQTALMIIGTPTAGFAGWYIKKRIERRWKHEDHRIETNETDIKERRVDAHKACSEILEIVGEYENAVRAAVEKGENADDTCKKIIKSVEANHFNYKIQQQLAYVSSVPECRQVALLSIKFALSALREKEALAWSLRVDDSIPRPADGSIPRPSKEIIQREINLLCKQFNEAGEVPPLGVKDILYNAVSVPINTPGPYDLKKDYKQHADIAMNYLSELSGQLRTEIHSAMAKLRV
jgi:hypothetical protein